MKAKKRSSKTQRKSPSRPKEQAATFDPGPIATSEQVQKASTGALALLQTILPLNLSGAANHIRKNPPDADAIAMLGFITHRLLSSERARHNARQPRKDTLAHTVLALDLRSIIDVKEKAPELLIKYEKQRLSEAIARHKRNLP